VVWCCDAKAVVFGKTLGMTVEAQMTLSILHSILGPADGDLRVFGHCAIIFVVG
jgi:hypothetical protein